jgi:hypothetical protein
LANSPFRARQGTSGYSGSQGYSGYSGISGYVDGYSGYSGYSGLVGPQGYSGYSGNIGSQGYSGYSGYSGLLPDYTPATYSDLGAIIVGDGLSIDSTGVLTISHLSRVIINDDYYIQDIDQIIVACGNSIDINAYLPSAIGSGKMYTLKNLSTNTLWLRCLDVGDTIDFNGVLSISQLQVLTVYDFDVNLWIIIY